MFNNKFFKSPYFNFVYIVFLMSLVFVISNRYFIPESLRLDESQSIWQANRSLRDMLEVNARDVHMPLYNILLHNWMNYFGNNIFTNRLLSLVFFILTIPMSFLVTRLITKKSEIGLYVGTLLTFSPFANWFGNELRMYSMLIFFTLCSHYYFLKLYEAKKTSLFLWINYFIFSLLGIYTHYFFILFIICQLIFFVFNSKSFIPGTKFNFLKVGITLAACISPWIAYVKYINTAGSQTPLLVKPSTVDLFNVYSNHFFGFQNDYNNSLILSMWPLFGVLCLYFLQKRDYSTKSNFSISKISQSNNQQLRFDVINDQQQLNEIENQHKLGSNLFSNRYIYIGLMAFLPTAILFLVSTFVRPVFLSRYLIMCLVPTYIIISSLLFSFQGKVVYFLRFGLVSAMVLALFVQITSPDIVVKENYRGIINYVINQSQNTDVIAVSAPFTIYPFYYYYNGSAKLSTIPQWDLTTAIPEFTEENLAKQMQEFKEKNKRLYLVLSYDQGYEKKIKNYADSNFKFISEQTFSPKLNLYIYDLK
jgi:mannosyltransferase